jgi:hypothetical protein
MLTVSEIFREARFFHDIKYLKYVMLWRIRLSVYGCAGGTF